MCIILHRREYWVVFTCCASSLFLCTFKWDLCMDFSLHAESSLAKVILILPPSDGLEGHRCWVIWQDDGRGKSIRAASSELSLIYFVCSTTFHEAHFYLDGVFKTPDSSDTVHRGLFFNFRQEDFKTKNTCIITHRLSFEISQTIHLFLCSFSFFYLGELVWLCNEIVGLWGVSLGF